MQTTYRGIKLSHSSSTQFRDPIISDSIKTTNFSKYFMKKKKSKQRGRIAKYWAGDDSLAFSFWGVSTIGLTMLQIPNWILLAQGDEIFDTMSDIGALFYFVYLIVFSVIN